MTTDVQKCKQCGEVKSMSQFRKYYGKLKGHYKACLDCEKINQRYKYLKGKEAPAEHEVEELQAIDQLYSVQRKAGLKPPRPRNAGEGSVTGIVEQQLERINAKVAHDIELADEVPAEIAEMLAMSFEAELPEDLQVRVDRLWDKYRPVIRVDESGPVYDERFKDALNQLQEKLDIYEEEFYGN